MKKCKKGTANRNKPRPKGKRRKRAVNGKRTGKKLKGKVAAKATKGNGGNVCEGNEHVQCVKATECQPENCRAKKCQGKLINFIFQSIRTRVLINIKV